MTQSEKIEMLKDTIAYLYEKEGRPKKYISDVLQVDRKVLTQKIAEWEFIKADKRHLTPSSQKFLNKNHRLICDMLDSDATMTAIARRLDISRKSLLDTFIKNDKDLLHHYTMAKSRHIQSTRTRIESLQDASSRNYEFQDLDGEEWKEILGYGGYFVSNMGRVKKWTKSYNDWYLLTITQNSLTGRGYVRIVSTDGVSRNLNVARLVAHAFVDGWSEQANTVDHLDGDVTNNRATNLEWVSQAENNQRAYNNGKLPHCSYSKNGKFDRIIIDGIYQFKTIRAAAKFLQVSESQANRYISGECKSAHTFQLIQ